MSLSLSPLQPPRRSLLLVIAAGGGSSSTAGLAEPTSSPPPLASGADAAMTGPTTQSAASATRPVASVDSMVATTGGAGTGAALTIWEADDSVGDRSLPSPAHSSVLVDIPPAAQSVAVLVAEAVTMAAIQENAGLESPAASSAQQTRQPYRVGSATGSAQGAHVPSIPAAPHSYSSPKHSTSSKKASVTAASSPTTPLASSLTLQQLLTDSRLYPLSLSEFRRFLVRSYVDELLEFLLALQRYKADLAGLALKAGKINSAQAVCMDEKWRLIAVKDGLVRRFIRVGSERELNLSESMRRRLLEADADYQRRYVDNDNKQGFDHYDFSHHKDLPLLTSLFDEAEQEVLKLVEQAGYVEHFFRQQTRNIDSKEIAFRRNQGIALLLLSLLLTVVLVLTVQARWYRLFVIPPLFVASTSLLTAQCGVCPMLQLQGQSAQPASPAQPSPAQPASTMVAQHNLSEPAHPVLSHTADLSPTALVDHYQARGYQVGRMVRAPSIIGGRWPAGSATASCAKCAMRRCSVRWLTRCEQSVCED